MGTYKEAFFEEYIVLDLETTGLSPVDCEIIEIGAILYKQGKKAAEFSALIKPKVPISSFITNLTGISNVMVAKEKGIEEVLPKLKDFLGAKVILAHNANFDVGFLRVAYERVLGEAFPNDYVDSMKISRKLFPKERHRLQDVTARFGVRREGAHRSISDCIMTHEVYEAMRGYCEREGISLAALPRKKQYGAGVDLKALVKPKDSPSESHPLFGKGVCVTGTLKTGSRQLLLQKILDRGGVPMDSVTKKTHILVIGDLALEKVQGKKSSKEEKAERYRDQGQPLVILKEEDFLQLL